MFLLFIPPYFPTPWDRIILLGLGGSHAYGTNNENSDIDFRGIALNKNTCEILGLGEDQYLVKTKLGQEIIDQAVTPGLETERLDFLSIAFTL